MLGLEEEAKPAIVISYCIRWSRVNYLSNRQSSVTSFATLACSRQLRKCRADLAISSVNYRDKL